MPQNFLDGCEAVEAMLDDVPRLTPEGLDLIITQAGVGPDSEAEELKFIQAAAEQGGSKIDSLAAVEAAEAAENTCSTCEGNRDLCKLGTFLRTKI